MSLLQKTKIILTELRIEINAVSQLTKNLDTPSPDTNVTIACLWCSINGGSRIKIRIPGPGLSEKSSFYVVCSRFIDVQLQFRDNYPA